MADARRSRRRLRRIAPLVALVVVIAAGGAAYAANSGGGPSYVTGVVTRGDAQQSLNLTGSVQQVNQVSAAFPVSGTVTAVNVNVGQQVSAGQQLASIDVTPLQSALLEAQATLAQAQATLQSDEAGTSSSSSTATTSADITGAVPTATLIAFTPTGSGRGSSGGSSGGSSDLDSLERAVTAAQAQAASSQAAVNTALLEAITVCATSPSPSPSPSGSPTPTPSGSATPTPSASASAHTAAYTSSGMTCADALAAVQRAETAEAAATRQLTTAVSKLAAAAAAAAQSSGGNTGSSGSGSGKSSGTGTGSSSGFSSGSTRSGGSFSGGQNSSGTGSTTNSASRIASDQAAVTTAQVAVTDAQRNLNGAVLRSPAAGTVASVGITKGATASTSSAITIVSQGAAQVTIDVPLASMPAVKVGQAAYVTANGATTADKGTVASIGLLPASSSTSTASYPVTVLVPDSDLMQMPTGSSAQVSLVMSTAHDVVTVPNSAVTRFGSGSTAVVTVLKNGTATRTRVTTGAVGTLATQIVSGLTVGQTIVLADRSASLPANSSTSTRVFGTGGGGGFAGFGGAGGTGGGTTRFGRGG